MPRVNVEEKLWGDRRLKALARLSSKSEYECIGRLSAVWRHCTDTEQCVQSKRAIDLAADYPGFADLLIEVDLARPEDGEYYLAGTRERCLWQKKLRERASAGGVAAASARRAKAPLKQERKHATGTRKHASSTDKHATSTLQAPTSALEERYKSACERPLSSSLSSLSSSLLSLNSLNTPDGSAVASRTISTEVDDWAEGTAPQQTLKLVADEERRTPEGSELRDAIDLFDAAFRKASGGQKPTWGAKQVAQVKGLLKRHGYDVFVNRVRILFERTPAWLSRDGTTPDLGTLISNYDRLAERVSKPSSAMSQTERLLAYADELRARGE